MATTGYNDRTFLVEVSGFRQQSGLSTSHYTFKVSYRSLARTLQLVRRNGGTIVRIQALPLAFPTQVPLPEAVVSNRSAVGTLDGDTIAAQPSPDVTLEQSPAAERATESTSESSESAQSSAVATPEEQPSPPETETKDTEPSKLSRLVSFFLNKLN